MSEPRFVEVTGPDVETAIADGLERLGASSKDVIVEVLEEGSRGGLFGLGKHQARVRLTLLAPPARPPAEEPTQAAEAPAAEVSPRPARRAPARKAAREAVREAAREMPREAVREAARPATAELDEESRVAAETLRELLAHMGVQAQVEVEYAEEAADEEASPLVLQVKGRDLGILIGRRGETLAALQYITRLIVSRELQRRADMIVDVEGYKARRAERLRDLALRLARQAAQSGRTVIMEPMPAYERRIIHLALKDRTDVFTRSEGEGDDRRVTVVPVRNR